MMTTRGKQLYPAPEDFGLPAMISIDERETAGSIYPMTVIEPVSFFERSAKNEDALGRPTHVCILGAGLALWPTPDKAYNVRVEYYPQPKLF